MKRDSFLAVDLEVDATSPLNGSMLSLGIAMFEEHRFTPLDTFYVKLERKTTEISDARIKAFWQTFPDQFIEATRDAIPCEAAMAKLSAWLRERAKTHTLKWVASPVAVDWTWLKTYYEGFGPPDKYDIGFYCVDLPSQVQAFMQMQNVFDKAKFKQSLAPVNTNAHHALHDAIHTGQCYVRIRQLIAQVKSDKIRRDLGMLY